MLFPAEYFLFVVFEVVHQLQAFAFVDKALDALHHAAPEVVVGIFPRLFCTLLRLLTLHIARASIRLLVPYFFDQLILAVYQL